MAKKSRQKFKYLEKEKGLQKNFKVVLFQDFRECKREVIFFKFRF